MANQQMQRQELTCVVVDTTSFAIEARWQILRIQRQESTRKGQSKTRQQQMYCHISTFGFQLLFCALLPLPYRFVVTPEQQTQQISTPNLAVTQLSSPEADVRPCLLCSSLSLVSVLSRLVLVHFTTCLCFMPHISAVPLYQCSVNTYYVCL